MPRAKKPPEPPTRKSTIDAIMLSIPGVVAKKIGGLDAYFVNDRMFACINGEGLGMRLPAPVANEMQFSRSDVEPFKPTGVPSSREWIQVNREDAARYEEDRELIKAAYDFVKGNR